MADKPKITNYANRPAVEKAARELFSKVEDGFKKGKEDQIDDIKDYWDIYNCVMSDNQIYDGDSQTFIPIVKDAVDARRKRFTTMLFPTSGRNLEVITESGDMPSDTVALLQHYIRSSNLRTKLPPVFINGDVEGQWSIMVDWEKTKRTVTRKVQGGMPELGLEWEDVEEHEVIEEGPQITILPAQDMYVWPPTVSNIQESELCCVKLRWTQDMLKRKAKDGWLIQREVDDLIDAKNTDPGDNWAGKERSDDAGNKIEGKNQFQLVYMIYTKMKLDDSKKVPAIVFLTGKNVVLGVVKNPYWNQKINIISRPAEEIAGSFWGVPKVKAVKDLQYQLNDVVNLGLDSAIYALLPIVMTDPLKNPRVASMILGKAAIWETSPNDTKLLSFPALYQHALTLKGDIKQQVMESMEVNDTMLGKAPAGRKNAQAIGQQQQEAMATIGDVVKRFEVGVCDELLEWFYELDLQFREDDLLVVKFGEHGQRAIMERIPVQQWNERYYFHWTGTDNMMGPQRIQQLIGMINVFRGFTPDVLNGRKLDLGPAIDQIAQLGFGPTLAGRILIDARHQMTVDPEIENQMLANGFDVPVSPMDDNQKHLQSHEEAAAKTSDPMGTIRRHIMAHIGEIQKQAMAQQPKGNPGAPGAPGQPGIAGQPRPGAMPMPGRNAQQPAGAVHADQMADGMSGMRG